jgi:hypothetical protein
VARRSRVRQPTQTDVRFSGDAMTESETDGERSMTPRCATGQPPPRRSPGRSIRRGGPCPAGGDVRVVSCLKGALVVVGEDRLRGLVEAGIALSGELSLQAVLERLLEQGSELTGASRAAIGILGSAEGAFERTLGDAELLARSTEPFTGKQLLETRIGCGRLPMRRSCWPTNGAAVTSRRRTRSLSDFLGPRLRWRSRTPVATSRRRAGCISWSSDRGQQRARARA